MKKTIYILGFMLFMGIITNVQLSAQNIINVGFGIGLSTPSDKLNDIYNSSQIKVNGVASDILSKAIGTGYYLGVKLRAPLNENATFVGGIGYNRFPEYKIDVKNPIADTSLFSLDVVTNIVPISAGLNYYILNDVVGIYGIGELTYNYIFTTVDYPDGLLSYPIKSTVSDSRIGFGAGAGFDIDFELLLINIEAKYNYANFIGQVADEKTKSYVTLGLMVFF